MGDLLKKKEYKGAFIIKRGKEGESEEPVMKALPDAADTGFILTASVNNLRGLATSATFVTLRSLLTGIQ